MKVKYDVSNVEGGDFQQAKPGLYKCKIESVEAGDSKAGNPQLKVVFKIIGGEFDGSNLFHYVPTDPDAPGYFRMKEFIAALGLKVKGVFDVDKVVGTTVSVRVKSDSYEGEYRARVGTVMPAKGDDVDPDDDDDEGDDENEVDAEEEEVDYSTWTLAELRAEVKERGGVAATILKGRKSAADKKEGLVDWLEENDLEEDAEEPEGEEPEEDDVEEEAGEEEAGEEEGDDDYDTLSVDELKADLKERGLRTSGKRAILIGRLRKDDESDEDPFA